jgi:hypothetical protein
LKAARESVVTYKDNLIRMASYFPAETMPGKLGITYFKPSE